VNFCSPSLPCREIRRALELVGPGDTILVADGIYKGFDVEDLHGLAGSPITIKAQGANAIIQKTTDRSDNRDTIFITFSSYIVVEGLRSFNANRAAIRVDQSPKVTIRNCVLGNNGTWGIFTDFSDDLLIANNETYGSIAEHGIYVSNSGDRPIVRGNRSHDNRGAGIHMNADVNSGGDGIITGAVIENNVIYNNGVGGGAGINMDGVQNSLVRNNVLYNNHATGIALFQTDGAEGPKGNKVLNNTVHQASDGRWALLVWRAWGTNFVGNNVLYHPNPARGGINFLSSADVVNTTSGYNILDRITPDDGGTVYTLAQWKLQGYEPQSISATPTSLFVYAAGGNFHLAAGSPAIDRGRTLGAVPRDRDGNNRPVGVASDIGAYEAGGGSPSLMVGPTSLPFGSVNVGTTKNMTLTVKNVGGGTLTGSAFTSPPFNVVGTASYSLSAYQTAVLTVRYLPTAAGAESKTLILTGGGGGAVSLTGTGVSTPPVLTVTPTSLAFGSVSVGSSKDLTVTVKNVGGGTLAGSASTSAPFSVVGAASYSLGANQTTVLTVRFSPTAPGAASRNLSLTGAGGGSVSLSGNGVPLIPELARWEAQMLTYGQRHCALYDDPTLTADQRLGATYYDAIRVFYQIADYTGNSAWNGCAAKARAVYRDAYVISNHGGVPGYWNFTTGLRMDWGRTGDALSKSAVVELSRNAAYAADATPLEWTEGTGLSREVAYAILGYLNAEAVGEPRRARLGAHVDQALGHIDQWFISKSSRAPVPFNEHPEAAGQYYLQPFMVGLTTQALIHYWEVTGDARVLPAIKTALDAIWERAWVPADEAFWYENWVPNPANPFPAKPGAPDLNLLIAPAFAWVYAQTGDTKYRDRGDQVFAGGVKGAWLDGAKQFNQNYMWSFSYVRWRISRP
jgi:hypothetical protein